MIRPPTSGCRAAPPTTSTVAEAYVGDGVRRSNSEFLDGLRVADAKRAIIEWLEANGSGRAHGHLQAARLVVQPAAVLG